MKNTTKGKVIKGVAVGIDVLCPLAATLTQFPVWVDKSAEATVSGLFVLFAALSAIPLFRQIKEFVKSPSAPIVWCVLFLLFVSLQSIISEMVIVCFWGMLSNLVGAGIYKLGDYVQGRSGDKENDKSRKEE